jgi:hypothetical protein
MVNNIVSVLHDRGWQEPEKHLFIYNVSVDKRRRRPNWYTFIVAKKTPITRSEREYFRRWIDSRYTIEYVLEQEESPTMDHTAEFHTQLEYLHGEQVESEYSRFLESDDRLSFFGADVLLTTTTDDRPFIFDVDADRRAIKGVMARIGGVSGALLCLTLGLSYFTRGRKHRAPPPSVILYFLVLGLGYFVVEVALLKLYQYQTGSPTNALVFVLGGLLLSTGLGSYVSMRYSARRIVWSFAGILLFASYHMFVGGPLLRLMGGPIWVHNIVVSLTVLPLGFCMGIPFPTGLERVKRFFPDAPVPLFVAVNSLASAFAFVFGLYFSIALGFVATALVGASCYAIALVLFGFIARTQAARTASPV